VKKSSTSMLDISSNFKNQWIIDCLLDISIQTNLREAVTLSYEIDESLERVRP